MPIADVIAPERSDTVALVSALGPAVISIPHDGLPLENFGGRFIQRSRGVKVHDDLTAEFARRTNAEGSVA